MITETLISVLKNDATLRGLLGASTAASAPIQASFAQGKVDTYLIAVEVVMGETDESGYESGVVSMEVHVKVGEAGPIAKATAIMKRIQAILDLKGSQLNDSYTTTVYRLRKIHGDIDFDQTNQTHVGLLSFEFYSSISK